jgi:hypothetical protein
MHDCASTKERIAEMLLGELDAADRLALTCEMAECAECACVHSSAAASLAALDEIGMSRMPDESYWPEYEASLRAKLEFEQAPQSVRWSSRSAAGNKVTRFFAASIAAACLFLYFGLWFSFRDGDPKQEESKHQAAAPSNPESRATPVDIERDGIKKDQAITGPRSKSRAVLSRSRALSKNAERVDKASSTAPLEVRVAEHVESIELLLRSFRNARPIGGESAPDVSFEKTLARKMIGQNNRLRYEAILSGELPVGDLLGSAEPFLLEIANLPENPSEDQTLSIRRLLKENGIISELRLYSVALRPSYKP